MNRAKQVFNDTLTLIRESQLPMTSSALAYTTILSVIPLLAVSFAIFQAFGGLNHLSELIEPLILKNLAQGAGEETLTQIRKFIANIHGGALGATGFIGLIITSMSLLSSIEKTVNKVWKTKIQRGLFSRIAAYWFIITIGPLSASLFIGYTSIGTSGFSDYLPSGFSALFITLFVFTAMNKWIPNKKVNWRAALIGGVFTTTLWQTAKFGYSIYNQKVVTYSKIYGSLGAIPIFLVWIYVTWLVILTGAALSAVIQNRLELQ
ncbi:MAG: YihY family inner membrane protein [Xanthomonadaceae bacterium]|nr:YihY family inner membrane protein [Xanthomonadaceae bacterium]